MTNMLVIGASPGNIGEAIAKGWGLTSSPTIYTPDIKQLDVTDITSISKYIVGKEISHTVYCAGIQHLGWIPELDVDEVDDVYQVNVLGFIKTLHALTNEYTSGRVCAVTSVSSRIPMRGSIAYCSSKAALNHAIRCAARELSPEWHITGVAPTTVDDTPLTRTNDELIMKMRGWTEEDAKRREADWIPMGRRATKQEVMSLVYDTLFGPEMLTGSIVEMAGGG